MIQVALNGATGIAFALDDDGDIRLVNVPGGGVDIALVEGQGEVEQAIRIRLQTRISEDPISPEVGLPVDQLVGLYTPEYISAIITQALLRDPRVKGIATMDIKLPDENRANRIGEVSFTVKLISGESLAITDIFGV